MAGIGESFGVRATAAEPTLGPVRARRAVVLAAGLSERMHPLTAGESKAHFRLGGVSLIERSIRLLLSLGHEDVIVVVGARSTSIERAVRHIAPGRARTLFADRWSDGNGASLAAVERELIDDPLFVVIMADHVFSDGAINELVAATRPSVLVDLHPDPTVWAEGTRVRIESGYARAFSKELAEPAVDCGAFVLTPAIFEAQRRASAEGDSSLAGAFTRFAARHPLAALTLPPGAWWHDIDAPDDAAAARRSLRRSLRKSTDGPASRFLNRPISTRISMAISGVRPNPSVISILALLLSAVGALLLARGQGIAGGALVQLASIVDGVDGEVARLQFRATAWGGLVDGVLDRVADVVVVAGLAIWALHIGAIGGSAAIALAAAATAGSMLSMATKDRAQALGLPDAPEQRLNLLLGGRDARLFIVFVTALAGRPVFGLAAILVTTTATLVARLLFVAKRTAQRERSSR